MKFWNLELKSMKSRDFEISRFREKNLILIKANYNIL